MFTLDQIKQAHSKVKSGADFPAYIKDLKKLGVTFYQTYVDDGHTDYSGADHLRVTSPARYESLKVEALSNVNQFKADLLAHQQGQTSFLTFCQQCAKSGIVKWAVCLENMTCTYYDKVENEILVEEIPEVSGQ